MERHRPRRRHSSSSRSASRDKTGAFLLQEHLTATSPPILQPLFRRRRRRRQLSPPTAPQCRSTTMLAKMSRRNPSARDGSLPLQISPPPVPLLLQRRPPRIRLPSASTTMSTSVTISGLSTTSISRARSLVEPGGPRAGSAQQRWTRPCLGGLRRLQDQGQSGRVRVGVLLLPAVRPAAARVRQEGLITPSLEIGRVVRPVNRLETRICS